MTATRKAAVAVVVAVATLVWGWLDVRRRSDLALEAEAQWRATLSKVEEPSVARHRTDATVYLAAALALERGTDPYLAQSPRGWRYVYPPFYAALLRPITGLRVADAAYALFVVNALALALTAWLLARAIGPPHGTRAVVAALLVTSPFLVQTFQRGQVTILLLALQVGAMVALLRGRDVLAGVLLALAVALRLTPLLVVAMLGAAWLARLRRPRLGPAWWRLPAGIVAGLVLGFVAVPVAFAGPERAQQATERWVASTREIYSHEPAGESGLLDYDIDEFSFKNQGVRRVVAHGLGADATSTSGAIVTAGNVAAAVGWGIGLIALWLGATRMRDRSSPRLRRAFAFGVFAPVFATRYAWPVHYVAVIPLVAESLAGAFATRAALVFGTGVALFYAAHSTALRPLAEYGVLLVAAAAATVSFLARDRRPRVEEDRLLDRYRDASLLRAAYRRARLEHGGFHDLAARLPARGLVVDLGAGEGLFAHVLVERAPDRRVLAVDHDSARVERIRASATGLPIDAVEGSMETAALPSCEAVAAVDVLHYLDASAQDALLRRAFGALRSEGVFLLRDPDAAASGLRFGLTRLHERIATGLRWTRAKIGRYRSADEWSAALRAAGFLEVEVLPLERRTPYADRVLVAKKPA